jgi:hypothetical protein
MATLTDEELKQRAALYLKRVTEIAGSATKTAIISFSALAIIWFGQIKPQYELLNKIYPLLPKTLSKIHHADEALKEAFEKENPAGNSKLIANAEQIATEQKIQAPPPAAYEQEAQGPPNAASAQKVQGPVPAASAQKVQTNAAVEEEIQHPETKIAVQRIQDPETEVDQKREDLGIQGSKLASLVNTVSFEVFGLKFPVPPLWAALVWNVMLLALLLYLARARARVWRLCAEAVSTLKGMEKPVDSLDDLAGSGPLWIAPPPSQIGKDQGVTVTDLRSAFGWNRLETLPSIAATAGFLLLGLLQLAVTAEGLSVIRAGNEFTAKLESSQSPSSPNEIERGISKPENLQERINKITKQFVKRSEPTQSDESAFAVEQRFKQLMVGPVEASMLSVSLILMLIGTAVLVVWWFRPWRVPSGDSANMSKRLAGLFLLIIFLLGVVMLGCLIKPSWGTAFCEKLAQILPSLTRFLCASVLSFCLIELIFLAFLSSNVKTPIVNDATRD